MKKLILIMCILGMMTGCTIKSPSGSKATTYTLDSVNPR